MRYLVAMVMACCGLSILHSCTTIRCGSNKDQFISAYEEFISDVRTLDLGITDSRWKLYDQRLATYLQSCYIEFEEDLSLHEKQLILSDALRYYYVRYGSDMIRELQDPENATSVMLKQHISGIWERPDEILREIIGKDWENLVNEFLQDLDKWKRHFDDLLEN